MGGQEELRVGSRARIQRELGTISVAVHVRIVVVVVVGGERGLRGDGSTHLPAEGDNRKIFTLLHNLTRKITKLGGVQANKLHN